MRELPDGLDDAVAEEDKELEELVVQTLSKKRAAVQTAIEDGSLAKKGMYMVLFVYDFQNYCMACSFYGIPSYLRLFTSSVPSKCHL